MSRLLRWFMVGVAVLMMSACGGGGAGLTPQQVAVNSIAEFARGGGDAPTVQDYIDAGVTGVDAGNLGKINAVVEALTYEDVDTTAEIQALADKLGVELDTTAPIITLTGANPQAIELGSAYSELNATTDDGSTVEINSTTVDTNTVGSYTVTYNATDSTGNSAIEVNRTVTVSDTTAPVITLTGANPQAIELGSAYSELNATTDDGSTVEINSTTVDTNTVGSYTVTYNAQTQQAIVP